MIHFSSGLNGFIAPTPAFNNHDMNRYKKSCLMIGKRAPWRCESSTKELVVSGLLTSSSKKLSYKVTMSTNSTSSIVLSIIRQLATAFAVSSEVRQGIASSTALRRIRTECRCGIRPLAEVEMI